VSKRKKDTLDRAMDAAVRSLKHDHPSIGMIARYPTKETPKGEEVAVIIALGDHAKRVARWLRRS
jgi:hypothetical protein